MKTPLVSFILLTYNQENFVRKAVEAALSQDYSPLEIVISDDSSSDNTFDEIKQVVARYEGPHEIILNRNERNLGIGAHINKVIQKCSGEWIVTAAGDDISASNRVSACIASVAGKPDLFAIGCGYTLMNQAGEILDESYQHPIRRPDPLNQSAMEILRRSTMADGITSLYGCAAMYRKALFDEFAGIPDNVFWEDQVLAFRALICGQLDFLENRLVFYRIHDSNFACRSDTAATSPKAIEKRRAELMANTLPVFDVWRRDLEHAHNSGRKLTVPFNDALQFIDDWRENRWIIGHWWSFSILLRISLLGKGIIKRRLFPVKFMACRLFPLSVFGIMPNQLYRRLHRVFR